VVIDTDQLDHQALGEKDAGADKESSEYLTENSLPGLQHGSLLALNREGMSVGIAKHELRTISGRLNAEVIYLQG
jgi:hypothetical protein